jgi:murein DD-endopeptidase MepM/ murein hydrolase activator NlpD
MIELWYPVKAPVSQKFGAENTAPDLMPTYRKYGLAGHNGWDFVCPVGTPVRATHDGKIVYCGLDGANGNLVTILGDGFKTLYGHLSVFKVQAGAEVKAGDIIALSGNTGASTGPHLHFGVKPVVQGEQEWVWWNEQPNNGYFGAVDPAKYWNNYYAENAPQVVGILSQIISLLTNYLKK